MQQPQADANAVAKKLASRVAELELQLAIVAATLESANDIITALRSPATETAEAAR